MLTTTTAAAPQGSVITQPTNSRPWNRSYFTSKAHAAFGLQTDWRAGGDSVNRVSSLFRCFHHIYHRWSACADSLDLEALFNSSNGGRLRTTKYVLQFTTDKIIQSLPQKWIFFRRYIYIYTILDVFVSQTPLVSHNYIKQSVEPPKSRTLAHMFLFFLIWNFNFFTYKHSVFCIICFNVLEMLLSFRARVVVRASDGKWGQKLRLRQNESRWALSSYRIILTQFSPIVKEQGFIQ